MNIKRILKWSGIGLIALFALFIFIAVVSGPSEKGQSIEQSQVTKQPAEQSPQEVKKEPEKVAMTDELAVEMIKTVLKNNEVSGVKTRIADGRDKGGVKSLILSYESIGKLPEETGHILGAYLGAVKSGWDIDELGVVVGDIYGTAVGMWYCSKDWTNDYTNGRITITELSAKVLGSMQSL